LPETSVTFRSAGRIAAGAQRPQGRLQGVRGGAAHVEGAAAEPPGVRRCRRRRIVAPRPDDGPRQRQRQLRVVGGLAGQDVPLPAVGQVAKPLRVSAGDLRRALELHPGAQVVAGDLPQEAPLSAVQQRRVRHQARRIGLQQAVRIIGTRDGLEHLDPRPADQLGRGGSRPAHAIAHRG